MAVRIIMGQKYTNYKDSLSELNLQSLEQRRKMLCLRFAKKCLRNEKLKNMFPKSKQKHKMIKRNTRKYLTRKNRTNRMEKSAIPYMTKLLNDEESEKKKIMEIS